jgi:integrase
MVKRGLRKKYRAPEKRKAPITLNILAKLVHGLNFQQDLKAFQFSAMMFTAHDACLRLKELLALRWSDISWVTKAGQPTKVRIRIRVSKSRYEEAAETLEIPLYQLEGHPLCAVSFLWAYMSDSRVQGRQGGDEEAFLFPNIRSGKGAQPRQAFVNWVQARLSVNGFTAAQFGGHSFRAGGATDLFKGHAPEVITRMIGRWRSREAYLLYIRFEPEQQATIVSEAYSQAYYQMCEAALLSKTKSAEVITAECDASELATC